MSTAFDRKRCREVLQQGQPNIIHQIDADNTRSIVRVLDHGDEPEVHERALERDLAIADRDRLSDECNEIAAERDRLTDEHNKIVAERDRITDERNEAVVNRNRVIAERDDAVAGREQLMDEHNKAIDEMKGMTAECDNATAERDQLATKCKELEDALPVAICQERETLLKMLREFQKMQANHKEEMQIMKKEVKSLTEWLDKALSALETHKDPMRREPNTMLTNPLPVHPTPANLLPDDLMHIDPPPENGPLVNIIARLMETDKLLCQPWLVNSFPPHHSVAHLTETDKLLHQCWLANNFLGHQTGKPLHVQPEKCKSMKELKLTQRETMHSCLLRFQSPLTPGATPLSNPSTPVRLQQSAVLLQSPWEQPFALNTDRYFQRALQSSPSHQKPSPTQIPISQHQLSEQTIAPPSDSLPSVFPTNDQPHSISTPSTAQVLPETIISQAPTQDGHWRQAMNNNSDNDIAATLLMGMRDLAKEVKALHNDKQARQYMNTLLGIEHDEEIVEKCWGHFASHEDLEHFDERTMDPPALEQLYICWDDPGAAWNLELADQFQKALIEKVATFEGCEQEI
ncbi:hypothetical protein CPB84DRAFT_1749671 [Gymnopilus junonius]|uniref:Uncharacterized protein n=1 Tax=Gymnopilus junonius TaxID=109634 RepID=A0A9P5NJV9_GYMJU|nr:hypothetical protein CPB84DRAFT_1749671 [Gymnopilus junonius]